MPKSIAPTQIHEAQQQTERKIEMRPIFLSDEELYQLTGKKRKALQINWLRQEAIPFRVNILGKPIVTRSTIEGLKPLPDVPTAPKRWVPLALGA